MEVSCIFLNQTLLDSTATTNFAIFFISNSIQYILFLPLMIQELWFLWLFHTGQKTITAVNRCILHYGSYDCADWKLWTWQEFFRIAVGLLQGIPAPSALPFLSYLILGENKLHSPGLVCSSLFQLVFFPSASHDTKVQIQDNHSI